MTSLCPSHCLCIFGKDHLVPFSWAYLWKHSFSFHRDVSVISPMFSLCIFVAFRELFKRESVTVSILLFIILWVTFTLRYFFSVHKIHFNGNCISSSDQKKRDMFSLLIPKDNFLFIDYFFEQCFLSGRYLVRCLTIYSLLYFCRMLWMVSFSIFILISLFLLF